MRDSLIKMDFSLQRFTKIQREYIKVNPDYDWITQKELEENKRLCAKEIDLLSSELLIKLADYYKTNKL